jgi:type IV pilus assembly protein PilE
MRKQERYDDMRAHERGITLIELLTVIVVLGILAAIAVPSYRSYLIRANRSDAKSALLQLQAAQEKFYIQNGAYTDKVKDAPPAGLGLPEITTHGFYKISVTLAADKQSYTATATPVENGGQDDDTRCGSFSITDTGQQKVSGDLGAIECWK